MRASFLIISLLGAVPASNAVAVTVPGAPTIRTATAGNANASIAFTAPKSNGGSVITLYTATCGSTSNTGTASPITVTGLTNGTIYSCSVRATNSVGTSTSSSTKTMTPGTAPGAPTIGTAAAGNASASVDFSAPTSNGGFVISLYTAKCGSRSGTGTASPITVTGLTNGTAYSCSVKATNSKGTSASSSIKTVTPATVPGAPTISAATAGNASASIVFTAPKSNGGSVITLYTATCGSISGSGKASPITVSGLTNGNIYSCSVKAANVMGSGASSSTLSVTPATTISGAPTLNSLTAQSTQISAAFTKSSTGATPTSFTATCTTANSPVTQTGTASPIIVTGLTANTSYSCYVVANTLTGSSAVSNSLPKTTSAKITYSTPSPFKTLVEKAFIPSASLTETTSITSRARYMISNSATATASSYLTIGDTYIASSGYGITHGALSSTSTYNDYLRKTIQFVQIETGIYRLDSYLHPNQSIDVDSSDSENLKFRNNFGKATTPYGYVTFSYDSTTKLLKAEKRYVYTYPTTGTSNGTTSYTPTYTAASTYSDKYVSFSNGVYSLATTGTKFYLYITPLSLDVPTFMNPQSVSFVSNPAAPFLSKVTTSSVEGTTGSIYRALASTSYASQVATAGSDTATKAAADAQLADIKATLLANKESLRYSTDVYTAFRDALLSTKLVSDSIADGTPGQNLVPYVYFTNEYATSGTTKTYHPFMVIVTYGNQASPNGLKDVPHPPGSGSGAYDASNVTRFSNLENYILMIPMKNYGQVSALTDNTFTKNLWLDGTTTQSKNVYNWADSADNGVLIDGSVMFPLFNNALYPSPIAGELSASGCHVGQGGGGPHCHADGYQSSVGLGLYNDIDYQEKTHPPLIGFGYDGIALFGRYRSIDSSLNGYSTPLDAYGAHDHDAIGYHYHAHTIESYIATLPNKTTTTVTDLRVLMKGAYIGNTTSIPCFRQNTGFNSNKYLGLGTSTPSNGC
jgi:hypothetical protein